MEIKIVVDDRVISFAARLLSPKTLGALAVLSLLVPAGLYAMVPHVFTPREVLSSSDMNQNFSDLDSRIGVYEQALHVMAATLVGIGVEEPKAQLHVRGSNSSGQFSDAPGILIDNVSQQDGSMSAIKFQDGNGEADRAGIAHIQEDFSSGAARLGFYIKDREKVTITDEGSLGIGTIDPSSALSFGVANATISVQSSDGSDSSYLHLTSSSEVAASRGAALRLYGNELDGQQGNLYVSSGDSGTANDSIFLQTRGKNRVVIKGDGAIGIGTTEPEYRLNVRAVGEENEDLRMVEFSAAGNHNQSIVFGSDQSSTPTSVYLLARVDTGENLEIRTHDGDTALAVVGRGENAGRVGIGTRQPDALLHISADVGEPALTIEPAGFVLPDCDEPRRGTLQVISESNNDILYVCLQKGSNNYVWIEIG